MGQFLFFLVVFLLLGIITACYFSLTFLIIDLIAVAIMMYSIKSITQVIILISFMAFIALFFHYLANLTNGLSAFSSVKCVGKINGGYIFKIHGYLWVDFTDHKLLIYRYYSLVNCSLFRSHFSHELFRNQYLGTINCSHEFLLSKKTLLQSCQLFLATIRQKYLSTYSANPIITKLFFNITTKTFEAQNAKLGINYLFCLSMIHLYILIKLKLWLSRIIPFCKWLIEIIFYCYLVGFLLFEHNSIPYFRAFCFLIFRKICRLLKWRHSWSINLASSAIIMLCLNLLVVFNYGFLLSYLYSTVILIILKYRHYRLAIVNKLLVIGLVFIVSLLVQTWISGFYSFAQIILQTFLLILIEFTIVFFFFSIISTEFRQLITVVTTKIITPIINYSNSHNLLINLRLTNIEFLVAIVILFFAVIQYNKYNKKIMNFLVFRKKLLAIK